MKRMLPVAELARDERFSRMRVEDVVFGKFALVPGAIDRLDRTRHFFGRPDHLADAVAAARAEIVPEIFARAQRLQHRADPLQP